MLVADERGELFFWRCGRGAIETNSVTLKQIDLRCSGGASDRRLLSVGQALDDPGGMR